MKLWNKVFIVGVVIFTIFDAILVFMLLSSNSDTNVNFVNLKPGISLKVNDSNKKNYEKELIGAGADKHNIIVTISPLFKKTDSGTGWGEGEPCYYSEWKNVGGFEILTIYADKNELEKLPQETKTKLLKMFIAHEINNRLEMGDNIGVLNKL